MALGRTARAAAVACAALLGAATVVRAALPGAPPATYDGLLEWLAGWTVVLGAGWLGLVAAAVALATIPGPVLGTRGRHHRPGHPPGHGLGHRPGHRARWSRALPAPAGWRRLVLLLCGVTVASTVAAPGHADARRVPPSSTAAAEGLPLPSRPAGRTSPPASRARIVTVRPGDSLWRLATAALPAEADAGRVAALVARTYAANRAVIGADPDLLQPGTRLALPPDERHRR